MLMRKLGRTGLNVAALCLGGNTFGWTTDQTASEAVPGRTQFCWVERTISRNP